MGNESSSGGGGGGGGDFGGGGFGGGGGGGGGRDSMSFGAAFSDARNEMGRGGTFEWRGNSYTTNRADDLPTGGGSHHSSSGGGGGFGGGGRDSMSFGAAFSDARNEMGRGGTFEWKGNSYTTNRADDLPTHGSHHRSGGGGGNNRANTVPTHPSWYNVAYSGASERTAASDKLTVRGSEASKKVSLLKQVTKCYPY